MQSMQGHRPPPPPPDPAAAAAALALVLGDDDLLDLVLLRLGSPAFLARAALVCRRWLRAAADPAFLRRFRARHAPRVLGFQVQWCDSRPRFLAVPQPPELAAAARRALAALVGGALGRVYTVRSLLRPDAPPTRLPPPPAASLYGRHMFLLDDGGGDAPSCLLLSLSVSINNALRVGAEFSVLQAGLRATISDSQNSKNLGAWGTPRRATAELEMVFPYQIMVFQKLIVGRVVYMLTNSYILRLDLETAGFATVELPEGAGTGSLRLSRGSGGLYLLDAAGHQLRVWHGDGSGPWALVDAVSVREACSHLNLPSWDPEHGQSPFLVVDAGDDAEFVLLQLEASGITCCMQRSSRLVERFYGTMPLDGVVSCHPITVPWPPIFPPQDRIDEAQH
ncbi:hypothetical protein ACP4OV_006901 [Aristida adscensionis]